jgi:hypothetical protein
MLILYLAVVCSNHVRFLDRISFNAVFYNGLFALGGNLTRR